MKTVNDIMDLESAMQELAITEAKREKARAAFELQVKEMMKKFNDENMPLTTHAGELEKAIKKFCVDHKKDFEKKRTLQLKYGKVGFENNPPKIACLKGWNEDKAVMKALELGGDFKKFGLTTIFKLNKETLKKWTAEKLEKIGLKIGQGESFVCEVKKIILPDA